MKVFSGLQLERVLITIQNCVWAFRLVSVRKMPTNLMDKCKRMTKVHLHLPAILKTNQQWVEML